MTKTDEEFGHWTTLEGRLEELRNRLVAWVMTSPQGFEAIWKETIDRYTSAIEREPNPYELDGKMLIQCFEEALSDHDVIWVTSQKLALELGLEEDDANNPDD